MLVKRGLDAPVRRALRGPHLGDALQCLREEGETAYQGAQQDLEGDVLQGHFTVSTPNVETLSLVL